MPQAAFAKMRSLIGEWHAPLPKNETMIDIFRPIAFGTALLHEEWKNGEQLTATVFYVDGSKLRADHFCDMGNQLRYVDESTDPQVLRWVLHDASNLDTHPLHFHSTTWRYVDAQHHVQDWEAASPGQAVEDHPHGLQASRRREGGSAGGRACRCASVERRQRSHAALAVRRRRTDLSYAGGSGSSDRRAFGQDGDARAAQSVLRRDARAPSACARRPARQRRSRRPGRGEAEVQQPRTTRRRATGSRSIVCATG